MAYQLLASATAASMKPFFVRFHEKNFLADHTGIAQIRFENVELHLQHMAWYRLSGYTVSNQNGVIVALDPRSKVRIFCLLFLFS